MVTELNETGILEVAFSVKKELDSVHIKILGGEELLNVALCQLITQIA